MNNKPIIVVSGEHYSVFLEIFFKSKKKTILKKPIILIASKELVLSQMNKLGFNFKINIVDESKVNFDLLDKKKINLINVDFKFEKAFDKISDKSNSYINKSFKIALKILKEKKMFWFNKWTNLQKILFKGKNFGYYRILIKKNKNK